MDETAQETRASWCKSDATVTWLTNLRCQSFHSSTKGRFLGHAVDCDDDSQVAPRHIAAAAARALFCFGSCFSLFLPWGCRRALGTRFCSLLVAASRRLAHPSLPGSARDVLFFVPVSRRSIRCFEPVSLSHWWSHVHNIAPGRQATPWFCRLKVIPGCFCCKLFLLQTTCDRLATA